MTASQLRLPPHRDPVPTRTRLRTRRLPVAVYAAALLLLPALVIGAAMTQGWWTTTGRTASAAATGGGGSSGSAMPEASKDTTSLPATTADVKGWMTVQQVTDAFPEITAPLLLERLGAPADTAPSTALKDLLEPAGMDVPALRSWLDATIAG